MEENDIQKTKAQLETPCKRLLSDSIESYFALYKPDSNKIAIENSMVSELSKHGDILKQLDALNSKIPAHMRQKDDDLLFLSSLPFLAAQKYMKSENEDEKQQHLADGYYFLGLAAGLAVVSLGGSLFDGNKKVKDFLRKAGKLGAAEKHSKAEKLKQLAYTAANKYPRKSANAIAVDIENEILELSKKVSYQLSPSNARNTIASWIRAYRKTLSSS